MERNRKKTTIHSATYEVHCPGSLEQGTKALNVQGACLGQLTHSVTFRSTSVWSWCNFTPTPPFVGLTKHIIIIFLDLPQIKSQSSWNPVSQSVKILLALPAPGGCMAVAHTYPYAHTDTYPSSTPTTTGFSVPPQGAALSFPDHPTQPRLYCSASSVSCWGFWLSDLFTGDLLHMSTLSSWGSLNRSKPLSSHSHQILFFVSERFSPFPFLNCIRLFN